MGFWKAIGNFFGGIFLLMGLTIFIMSYFGSYAISNLDLVEGNILNDDIINLVEDNKEEIEMMKSFCEQNPNNENCDVLDDPNFMAVLNGEPDEEPPCRYN